MLSCDPRSGPDMYSSDIISSYIFFKTAGDGWQFAKMVGLAENAESVMFPYTIKMLDWGKLFIVLPSTPLLGFRGSRRSTKNQKVITSQLFMVPLKDLNFLT